MVTKKKGKGWHQVPDIRKTVVLGKLYGQPIRADLRGRSAQEIARLGEDLRREWASIMQFEASIGGKLSGFKQFADDLLGYSNDWRGMYERNRAELARSRAVGRAWVVVAIIGYAALLWSSF